LVRLGERGQHRRGLLLRPLVEQLECRAARRGELDQLTARISGRAVPADQPAGLEPGQHAAQVARVKVKRAAQLSGIRPDAIKTSLMASLRDLEDHPRLGQ